MRLSPIVEVNNGVVWACAAPDLLCWVLDQGDVISNLWSAKKGNCLCTLLSLALICACCTLKLHLEPSSDPSLQCKFLQFVWSPTAPFWDSHRDSGNFVSVPRLLVYICPPTSMWTGALDLLSLAGVGIPPEPRGDRQTLLLLSWVHQENTQRALVRAALHPLFQLSPNFVCMCVTFMVIWGCLYQYPQIN